MAKRLRLRTTSVVELATDELAAVVGGGFQTQGCVTSPDDSCIWCLTGHYTGLADR